MRKLIVGAEGKADGNKEKLEIMEKVDKYLEMLLAATREELVRADTKASILLAASGVVLGALFAALLAGDWSPSVLDNRVEWIWWLAVLMAASGVIALAMAVYPKTISRKQRPISTLTYFGDVGSLTTAGVKNRIQAMIDTNGSLEADQIVQIAPIVVQKYAYIKFSFWAFAFASALAVVSVILNIRFEIQ